MAAVFGGASSSSSSATAACNYLALVKEDKGVLRSRPGSLGRIQSCVGRTKELCSIKDGTEMKSLQAHITRHVEAVPSQFRMPILSHDAAYNNTTKLIELARRSLQELWQGNIVLSTATSFSICSSFIGAALAESMEMNTPYGELGADLEVGAQVLYLAALLGLISVASFFVVRQFLVRRELEMAAKSLQDRVRTGEALPVEYFELGAIMLRKKFFGLAARYLEQAVEKWDEDPQELAQVHNALGFSLVSDGKVDKGIAEYEKAVKLQPGYIIAWNNLGSAYQKKKDLPKALKAFEQALLFDPNNKVAKEYRDALKVRVERLKGVPIKSD